MTPKLLAVLLIALLVVVRLVSRLTERKARCLRTHCLPNDLFDRDTIISQSRHRTTVFMAPKSAQSMTTWFWPVSLSQGLLSEYLSTG